MNELKISDTNIHAILDQTCLFCFVMDCWCLAIVRLKQEGSFIPNVVVT